MKKMPLLFERDFTNPRKPVTLRIVTAGCEWVINGEGIATRKYDGTCCLVKDRQLFARYDAKHGKTPPSDFIPAQDAPDEITGHFPGWVPVGDKPQFKYHREAWDRGNGDFAAFHPVGKEHGTYELVGPKINGNPDKFEEHRLIPHGSKWFDGFERTFDGIKEFLRDKEIEGIVFWRDYDNPDCEKVKIRKKDFDYTLD